MDLNVKIIDGVKKFPILHDNCGDLDERNRAWTQLADMLDMHEQILQVRWHALLQMYQRDANFKYSNRMQFISRNEEILTKSDNWPEFVITEEYLKSCNNEDQEQFVFLETEEENDSQNLKPSQENDCNFAEAASDKKTIEANRTSIEQHEPTVNNVKTNTQRKSKEPDVTINTTLKEKEAADEVNLNRNNNHTSFEESKNKPSEKVASLTGERCEDVIFGELVSAMLKRMDEDKKKSIKKEIMNILFS